VYLIHRCTKLTLVSELHRYYAFDDDYMRGQGVADSTDDEELQKEAEGQKCRRVSEHRLNFQNCNIVFELPLLEYNVKYLK
jgi:hypothetical protein